MYLINKVLGRLRAMTAQQFVVAGAFAIAMTSAAGLGMAVNQSTSAATVRECGSNSIDNADYAGGCGATSKTEFISDVKNNKPSDLKAIYAHFGLPAGEYDNFLKEAKEGMSYKNGTIVVDGQVVSTGNQSLGRNDKGYSSPYKIGDKTYHASKSQDVFAVDAIPVLVLFNDKGEMQFAVMKPCGNPIWGTKKTPKYECTALNKTAVAGKKDTYRFTTSAVATNNASIVNVVYDFGDGNKKIVTNPSEAIEHAYTKPGTYTATVTVNVKLPGNKQVSIPPVKCKTTITVVAPLYECVALMAATNDPKKQKFTFTVKTNQRDAVLKSADFTFDGKDTVANVKANTANSVVTERTFTDSADHIIKAKVNFEVAGKMVSVTSKNCETKITSTKTPVCVVDGKEFPYPPEDERCKPEECEEGVPKGSPDCETTPPVVTPPAELPHTGAGSVAGLFAGTSVAGAAIHRVISSRRHARSIRKQAAQIKL